MQGGGKEWFIEGQTVHTQGHPGHERVIDFYNRVTAVVNKTEALTQQFKCWWGSVAAWGQQQDLSPAATPCTPQCLTPAGPLMCQQRAAARLLDPGAYLRILDYYYVWASNVLEAKLERE